MTNLAHFFITQVRAQTIQLDLTKIKTSSITFDTLWTNLYQLIFAFLALMAFVGIVYSGILMITAGGDSAKFAQGRKNLLWSIIGIVIVTLSYVIIKFTYSFIKLVK